MQLPEPRAAQDTPQELPEIPQLDTLQQSAPTYSSREVEGSQRHSELLQLEQICRAINADREQARRAAGQPIPILRPAALFATGVSPDIIAEMSTIAVSGAHIDTDATSPIGDRLFDSNHPSLYAYFQLVTAYIEKELESGRWIEWPHQAPDPWIVTRMALHLKAQTIEEAEQWQEYLWQNRKTLQSLAEADYAECRARSGKPLDYSVLPQLPTMPTSELRIITNYSRPGNMNMRNGDPVPFDNMKFLDWVQQLEPGDSMWKIDLTKAFRKSRQAVQEWLINAVALNGRILIDTCLNFGARSNPSIYNSQHGKPLLRMLVHKNNQMGIRGRVQHHVDDFYGNADRLSAAQQQMENLREAVAEYRSGINEAKTVGPTRTLSPLLGFVVSTEHGRVTITFMPHKMHKIRTILGRFDRTAAITLKDLESVVGQIISLAMALEGAVPFSSELLHAMGNARRNGQQTVRLTHEICEDIAFFTEHVTGMSPTVVMRNRVDVPLGHLTSDAAGASSSGPHGYLSVVVFGYCLVMEPPSREHLDISDNELVAAIMLEIIMGALLGDAHIQRQVDNQTAIGQLAKGRASTYSRMRAELFRAKYRFATVSGIRVRTEYISTDDNTMADAGSHADNEQFVRGAKTYLTWLQVAGKPNRYPDEFPFPPMPQLVRVPGSSAIGHLVQSLCAGDAAALRLNGVEIRKVLHDIRTELAGIARQGEM